MAKTIPFLARFIASIPQTAPEAGIKKRLNKETFITKVDRETTDDK